MSKKTALSAAITAVVCVSLSACLQGQVEVVDSQNRLLEEAANRSQESADANVQLAQAPTSDATPSTSSPSTAASASRSRGGLGGSAELYNQVQLLQQEVLELRGLVEEQAYELRRLKQQRLDDYVNLDRRLSAITSGGSAVEAASGGNLPMDAESTDPAGAGNASGAAAPAMGEVEQYRSAIDLVLRQKDYSEAIVQFKAYLEKYPEGQYVANSEYWLGEIYLLEENLESARDWFSRLLDEHGDHSKAPDAAFKLGTVYHRLGDDAKAREILEEVAKGDTNAARLASNYLSSSMN